MESITSDGSILQPKWLFTILEVLNVETAD